MSISIDIRGALQSQLDEVVGIPSSMGFEGATFDPVPGTAHLICYVIPTVKTPDLPGASAQHQGIFQVDLYYPHGLGTNAIEQAADAIRSAYGAGTKLFNAGTAVTIYRTETRGPAVKEADWIRLTTEIYWRAHAAEQ